MEPFVRNFIRASLVWLGVGVSIGLWMAIDPAAVIYRPAHMHANLLGFVSMMIFGVAYHVIPRFSGAPLRSRRAAQAHLLVSNVGLTAMVSAWLLRGAFPGFAMPLLAVGGILSTAGAFLFIGNVWLTLGTPVRQAGGRPPVTVRA